MPNNVIKLHGDIYAACQCGSINFKLLTDDVADRWNTIIGTECSQCGYKCDWIKVNKTKDVFVPNEE